MDLETVLKFGSVSTIVSAFALVEFFTTDKVEQSVCITYFTSSMNNHLFPNLFLCIRVPNSQFQSSFFFALPFSAKSETVRGTKGRKK